MQSHVFIVADTGSLKAYYVSERSLIHRKKADLIKKITYTTAHTKLSNLVSDRRGSFRGSGDARSSRHGAGEAHNMKSEMDKKALRSIAHDVEGIIKHTAADKYYLSIPKPMHNAFTTELKQNILSKITKVLPADLTKDTLTDIRKRFGV